MARRSRLQIGDLAQRTGVSVKALRLYDERGLLAGAGRSAANYRLFTQETVNCVQCIRALQAAGLTLREMQEVADAYRSGAGFADLLLQTLVRALARLDEQTTQLEAKRARLQQLLANVETISSQRTA